MEQRLIDANALYKNVTQEWDGDNGLVDVLCIIDEQPTVDAVPIRCRDCKWFKSGIDIDGKPFTRCDGSVRTYGHTAPDWFCADGEMKDNE